MKLREAAGPNFKDAAIGAGVGPLWAWVILSQAPSNGTQADLAIIAVYLGVYCVTLATLAWLARLSLRPLEARIAPPRGHSRPLGLIQAIPAAITLGVSISILTPSVLRGSVDGLAYGLVAGGSCLVLALLPPKIFRGIIYLGALALPIVAGSLIMPRLQALKQKAPISLGDTHTTQTPYSVRLLGIDGVDLALVESFIDEGIPLPNFKRMIDLGTSAKLETPSPHSPVVWTSIATGRRPEDHGVKTYSAAFLRGVGVAIPNLKVDLIGNGLDRLINFRQIGAIGSNERQVKAIWELLADLGKPGLMINWWASFPAEHVEGGAIVSNHIIPWDTLSVGSLEALRDHPDLVYPPELQGEALDIAQSVAKAQGLGDLERDAFSAAGWAYYKARDDMVWALYDSLFKAEYVLSTPYFQGVDTASHAYTTIVYGKNVNKRRPKQVSEAEAEEWWQELVVESYLRMDARLGVYLDGLGPKECLIVVSDHGWAYDGTSHWNRPPGVFLAVGEPFKAGRRLSRREAHVYDVLPTIAQVLGIPLSKELAGAPLIEAFEDDFEERYPGVSIDAYGDRRQALIPNPSTIDDGHIERLKALGYID